MQTLLIVLASIALPLFVGYGYSDAKERSQERQALHQQASYYKTLYSQSNECETDSQCEKLDAMLDAIHASYTLD